MLTSQPEGSLTPELCVKDGPGECQWVAPFVTANELGGIGPFHQRVTIRTLTDDALLEIFDAYVDEAKRIDAWYTLVHVCRRWRRIVFASPRRLRLQLLCTNKRPVRKMLRIWPALPIIIWTSGTQTSIDEQGADNIIAALEQSHRVCGIVLRGVSTSLFETFAAAAQDPFPALKSLALVPHGNTPPVLPEFFLGGFAECLQSLWLNSIELVAVQKILLSAADIVDLHLWDIPNHGYMSPEDVAHCLSTMARLESLRLGFHPPRSRFGRIPPPPARAVLPSLAHFFFKGTSEYLEDLVARIDAPLLGFLDITFFHQLVFDISQLPQFIGRTEKSKTLKQADVLLDNRSATIRFSPSPQRPTTDHTMLAFRVSCRAPEWQLSSLVQVCRSSMPLLPTLERLDVREDRPHWQDDMENAQWLELLYPFATVRHLSLSEELALRIAPALQELNLNTVAEVLPALQNLFLEGYQTSGVVGEAIAPFVAMRQFSGHPVAIHRG
jgi:hypothetical protein